jgi:hypothetical protein
MKLRSKTFGQGLLVQWRHAMTCDAFAQGH